MAAPFLLTIPPSNGDTMATLKPAPKPAAPAANPMRNAAGQALVSMLEQCQTKELMLLLTLLELME